MGTARPTMGSIILTHVGVEGGRSHRLLSVSDGALTLREDASFRIAKRSRALCGCALQTGSISESRDL